jgi:hypothetical protein
MGFRYRLQISLEEFVPLVHRALDGTPAVARPVQRRSVSPIVPLMLGAAVGGVMGLAIINWPGPAPIDPLRPHRRSPSRQRPARPLLPSQCPSRSSFRACRCPHKHLSYRRRTRVAGRF